MEPENRSLQQKPEILNEHFAEPKTKEALRILILQRFTEWLDDVLAEEKPLEGVAAELLAELYDGKEPDATDPGAGANDLHSTWSAMTALTQEIKLQGRAFKQLSEKMAPFDGLDAAFPSFSYEGIGRDDGKREGEFSAVFYNQERFEKLKGGTICRNLRCTRW